MPHKNSKKAAKAAAAAATPSKSSSTGYYEDPSPPENAKVTQVLELLDEGKPQLALKSMKAILAHWPKSLTSLAINAICLQRTGHGEEALQQADFVAEKGPNSPNVLRFLSEVYRRSPSSDERLLALYSAAAERNKGSEMIQAKLFECYARNGDWKSMQQVAGSLLSAFPSSPNHYAWWRVAALRAQCELEGNTASAKQKRSLCAAMAARLPSANVGEAELLCAVLMEGERYDLVEKVLSDGQAVGKLLNDDLRRRALLAEAQEKLGHFEEAMKQYVFLLSEKNAGNNWKDYMGVLRCALALEEKNKDGKALEEAKKLFVSKEESGDDRRGGILAQIKFELEVKGVSDEMKRHLLRFIKMFSCSLSCLADIRPYVKAILEKSSSSGDESEVSKAAMELSKSVKETLGVVFDEKNLPDMEKMDNTDVVLMANTAFVLMFDRIVGIHASMNAADIHSLVKSFCCVYNKLSAMEEQREEKDNDVFLVCIAETFRDIYERNGDERVLLEAAALLESALEKRVNRAQVRLALLDIYVMLGAGSRAMCHFNDKTFGMKHVLLESCSHHVLDLLLNVSANAHEEGTNLLKRIISSQNEAVFCSRSTLESSFQNKSFLFASDAASLFNRMDNSALKVFSFVELFLSQFNSLGPKDLATGCGKLCDVFNISPEVFTDDRLICNADKKASVALDLFPVTEELKNHFHRDTSDPFILTKPFLELRYSASQVLRCLPAASCGKKQDIVAALAHLRKAICQMYHPDLTPETIPTTSDLLSKLEETTLSGAIPKETESLVAEFAYNVLLTAGEYASCYIPDSKTRSEGPAKQDLVIRGVTALKDLLLRSVSPKPETVTPITPFASLARCMYYAVSVVGWISVIACDLTILAGPKGAWSVESSAKEDFELAEKVLACTTSCAKCFQTNAIPMIGKQQADPESFCVGFQNWLARGNGHTEGLDEKSLGTVATGVSEGREDIIVALIDSVASLAL